MRELNELPYPVVKRMLLEKITASTEFNDDSKQKILYALKFAEHGHDGMTRDSSDQPYIIHPVRMAYKLLEYYGYYDENVIIAIFFHDLVEDTDIESAEIAEKFGKTVAEYVDKMTRHRVEDETPEQKHQSKVRKMQDLIEAKEQVKVIKAIDLVDNCQDWPSFKSSSPLLKKIPRWLKQMHELDLPFVRSLGDEYAKPLLEVSDMMRQRGYTAQTDNNFQA